jgi:hypothetical protein
MQHLGGKVFAFLRANASGLNCAGFTENTFENGSLGGNAFPRSIAIAGGMD